MCPVSFFCVQESYKEKEKAIEEERLKKMVESLSEEEKQKIYEQGIVY